MDIYTWMVEQEQDLLYLVEDWLRSNEMAPKNSAFAQGVEAAQQYLLHTIAITEQEWKMLAEQYASGHLSSPSARRHFEQGWLTVSPATFAQGEQVVLQVRIMNVYPDSLKEQKQMTPPEKEMYEVLGAGGTITFVGESKVCFTYKVRTSCGVLNSFNVCAFLRRKQVSYKMLEV